MKNNYAHLVLVVDRSGSMNSLWDETVSGVKSYVEEQKKDDGEATITIHVFDSTHDEVVEFKNIEDVVGDEIEDFPPRGMTAMYDAIGFAIDKAGERLAAMDEASRPSKVMFLIVTDGQENCSQRFSADDIKKKIQRQEGEYSWSFTYMGANQDAVLEGAKFGLRAESTVQYGSNARGVNAAYVVAARSARVVRSAAGHLDQSFSLGMKSSGSGVQIAENSSILDDKTYEDMLKQAQNSSDQKPPQ